MLIGNLGADPEVRSTTGGNRVATFSVATSRTWNNQAGERQEKTEWHRCVVWNTKMSQLADVRELIMLGGKSGGSEANGDAGGAAARPRVGATEHARAAGGGGGDFEDFP